MELNALLKDCEEKMKKSLEVMTHEFSTIRTGKASPALVDGMTVDCYGSQMRLKEVAGISTPEPRTIVIQPWDPSQIPAIEKAILSSGLGLQPMNDGKVIRLPLPELTQERRESLTKLIKKIAEEGKVSLRNIRRDLNTIVDKMEKDKKITEDEKFKTEKKIQEKTNHYIKNVDDLLKHKEHEILTV